MSRKRDDLTGKKYGLLTVVEYDRTDQHGETYWLCKCDCGNPELISVRRQSLRHSLTTSCGCKLRGIKDDLTGKRFGRLSVVRFANRDSGGRSLWLCVCDCGSETVVEGYNLKSGQVQSCGCLHRETVSEQFTRHGMSTSRIYRTWSNMHQRCENENIQNYNNYGGRGISVCDEWGDFENFKDWSLEHGYAEELSIDRINNNLGYFPENCRWTDGITQRNNTRRSHRFSYEGENKTIAEWSRCLNVVYTTLLNRINRGDLRDFERYFNNKE